MEWSDIAMLMFSCVAANHLGLIGAIEEKIGENIHIVNCPRCFTFWSVLITTLLTGWNIIEALAVSFLSSWMATWLELGMGFIDLLYLKLYGKITANNQNDTLASDVEFGDSASTVSELQ